MFAINGDVCGKTFLESWGVLWHAINGRDKIGYIKVSQD